MKIRTSLITYVIAAFCLGAVLYSVSAHYMLSQSLKKSAHDFLALQKHVLTQFFIYGTVTSIDHSIRVITVEYANSAATNAGTIAVHVTDTTSIFRQDLESNPGGAYVGISSPVPGTFDDLLPGTRVAVSIRTLPDGLAAMHILFGNPL